MTVLSVARNACLVLGIDQPNALLTNTDREYQELARLCNDTAKMIAEDFDWQKLQALNTITGDGSTAAWDLPSDYLRMLQTGRLWSSRWIWAIEKITSTDIWLEHQVASYTNIAGEWIIYGDQFHFNPTLSNGETIKFYYIKDTIVTPSSGSAKTDFTADDDSFSLSERLLELGIIWRWKKDKGLPFDAAKAEYDDLFTKLSARDSGSRTVISGNQPHYIGANIAFPQTVGGV
jgi:hypothetical protein